VSLGRNTKKSYRFSSFKQHVTRLTSSLATAEEATDYFGVLAFVECQIRSLQQRNQVGIIANFFGNRHSKNRTLIAKAISNQTAKRQRREIANSVVVKCFAVKIALARHSHDTKSQKTCNSMSLPSHIIVIHHRKRVIESPSRSNQQSRFATNRDNRST
jgi:hypothetical protein